VIEYDNDNEYEYVGAEKTEVIEYDNEYEYEYVRGCG
jgi:hypothetical protein